MSRRRDNLKRLLSPRHVAYVGGAAREPAIRMCVESFDGPVWPVNATRESLAGVPCFARLADLPEAPDVAYLAVPAETTIDMVRELAAMGAGGAVCYAAGFAEIGGEGVDLQRRLAEAAGDLALVGPNCYGILNYLDGVSLWPIGHPPRRVERGAAFIAQSGNISLNVMFNQRSVPFSYIVSSGNEAVLSAGDFIEALLDNPRVNAIGVYLEAVSDVAQFSRAAARALEQGVPIVALKAGRSEKGRAIALTHTGSMAGSDVAYGALFDRLGIVRANTPAEMLEYLKVLSVTGPLPGNRLAVFTCSGGEAALAADIADDAGVDLPPLSEAQRATLGKLLPHFAHVANPLDYNTTLWGDRERLETVFATVMDHGYDAALLIIDYLHGSDGNEAVDAAVDALIAARRSTGLPTLYGCSLSESVTEEARERMIAAGIAPLQDLEHAVRAAGVAAAYGARRRNVDTAALALPPAGPEPANPTLLDEHESKRRLAAHGLTVPEGRVAVMGDVAAAAQAVGFPVALKVLDANLVHKTDAGALRLNLDTAADVERAADGMGARRFLVEAMVADAVCELIVGVRRDPDLGLVLVIGSGGVLVEALDDSRALLLPTNRAAVHEAIRSLKAARLIAGYRGRPAGDMEAAVDAVLAIAAFAEAERANLVELDVNPLMLCAKGAVAADAVINISDSQGTYP